MINAVEVYMWGTRIGLLYMDGNRPFASFEYDKDFMKSGIEIAPICMPLSNKVYEFPNLVGDSFHGVPGLVADSLPDKFGNAVINQWLASQGKVDYEFGALDRLCYTGSRGMGALEYVPANGPELNGDEEVDISKIVELASDILNDRTSTQIDMNKNLAYSQLLQLGTSAGGARAKALIAWNRETNEVRSGQIDLDNNYEYWLMKFDGVISNGDHGLDDKPEYTLVEYAYYKMALKAGIKMTECKLFEENGRHHFMTKRFDRIDEGKLHMQTLGALCHIDYNYPGLFSYEQAALTMKQLRLPADDIEQLFRRMVFNVLAINQDDHVKNFSFLMDKKGKWSLAPAYDLTFAYDLNNRWLCAHQMLINNKDRDIKLEDLVESGKKMDISSRKINIIIDEVRNAVAKWEELATEVGVSKPVIKEIKNLHLSVLN